LPAPNVATYDATRSTVCSRTRHGFWPETDKLNVNYVNVDAGGNIGRNEEYCFDWRPAAFFTNAATGGMAITPQMVP